jgi:hypothetical protein
MNAAVLRAPQPKEAALGLEKAYAQIRCFINSAAIGLEPTICNAEHKL